VTGSATTVLAHSVIKVDDLKYEGQWNKKSIAIMIACDDINPANLDEVIWAIGTRINPQKDFDIIRNTYASPLDPIYPKQADKVFFGARAIIDACRPYDWIRDFPKVAQASPDLKRKVLDKWRELFS
jgi:3-polyprenyl-4-hydroxybenzoate decarboxylase